ncbi:hypothetical protein K443DRAFT_598073 [Laccaria amethystina LaAM-08-1]|uniref:Uncharacterized protein n=1 Tax=Laccaria amethystina LaAM-08-1 TaxID=1095629 RepID=A0A0C9WL05_9AGAR|nr:hypothetical protein K443DRAFT_598073 [Laccaria amethystina LaAM-08-1]
MSDFSNEEDQATRYGSATSLPHQAKRLTPCRIRAFLILYFCAYSSPSRSSNKPHYTLPISHALCYPMSCFHTFAMKAFYIFSLHFHGHELSPTWRLPCHATEALTFFPFLSPEW